MRLETVTLIVREKEERYFLGRKSSLPVEDHARNGQ